ncbi:MAG TPA: 50S ribosomal protein L25 [Clostridia bacterium]|nr:50S ribosomal protein L25 [Clostridia bacterium]
MATAIGTNMVEAKPRVAGDKNDARRLRQTGMIPAVLYGAGLEPLAVSVDPKQMTRILHSETGHNTIFDVTVDGTQAKAMIVDWQFEPIKSSLLHVDLKRIAMDKVLRLKVPITLKGEAPGVKQQGGVLEHVLREVEIECLPGDIPSRIDVDISNLVFGVNIRIADLPKSDKIMYLSDENAMIVHLTQIKEEVAPAADAVATEVAAGPAEPEVIKKGKQETEEAGEEKAKKK